MKFSPIDYLFMQLNVYVICHMFSIKLLSTFTLNKCLEYRKNSYFPTTEIYTEAVFTLNIKHVDLTEEKCETGYLHICENKRRR